jgi:hypothetical protein
LIGIGAILVALYGHTWFEEVLWSIAGMCAPLVALVPTTPRGQSTWPILTRIGDGSQASEPYRLVKPGWLTRKV